MELQALRYSRPEMLLQLLSGKRSCTVDLVSAPGAAEVLISSKTCSPWVSATKSHSHMAHGNVKR